MNILDTIVYSIWFNSPSKYMNTPCSLRNRLCGVLHVGGILVSIASLIAAGSLRGLTTPLIFGMLGAMLITSIPRFLITEPPELPIQREWLRNQTNAMIKVKNIESGEMTDMLYNSVYNQGVVYTEEGMQIVDLPLYNYNKTWLAFDSDHE